MRHQSFVNLWDSIENFMNDKGHNMQSIKAKNPFPISSRTISNIKKTRYEKDGKGYQKAKLIKLCEFLEIPYSIENKVLKIDEIGKNAAPSCCNYCTENCGSCNK